MGDASSLLFKWLHQDRYSGSTAFTESISKLPVLVFAFDNLVSPLHQMSKWDVESSLSDQSKPDKSGSQRLKVLIQYYLLLPRDFLSQTRSAAPKKKQKLFIRCAHFRFVVSNLKKWDRHTFNDSYITRFDHFLLPLYLSGQFSIFFFYFLSSLECTVAINIRVW